MPRISTLLLALSVLVVGLMTADPSVAGQHCTDTTKTGCLTTTREKPVKLLNRTIAKRTLLTSSVSKRPKPRTTKAPAPTTSPTPTATPTPAPTPTVTPTPIVTPTPTSSPTPPATGLVPPVAKDCSVDVTDALNAWLATVPDGAMIDLAGGCYRSNGTLSLTSRSGLVIEGHGAIIKATTNAPDYTNRAQLALNLGSHITVRNLTLEGTNATPDCAQGGGISCYRNQQEWDHNLRITGTDGVLVDHVTFRHAWGDAVAMSPGGSWDSQGNGALMARNITVQNSSVDTTGRMAFGCTGCHSFTAQDNTITNVGYHVVDVEVEAPAWTGDATLLRNSYSNTYLSLLSSTTGDGARGPFVIRDNVRTDAVVTCYGAVGISSGNLGYPVSSVEITGNHFTSLDDPIRVSDAQSVTITNNYAETIGCNGDYSANGVTLTNDGPSTVTGNTFPRAGKVAVLSSTPVATVCQNRLTATALFDQPVAC